MKKRILITGILICSCLAGVVAQHNTIGIKGGMNISHLSVSGLSDENNRTGYHVGLFGRIGISPCFSIQPEALISSKGAELNFNNAFVTGGTVLKLQYIEVPVLAVFHAGAFNFHVGPYASFLLDATVKNTSDDGGADFESEIDKDNFNNVDAGVVAGAGLELGALAAGVRYVHGMCNVGKDKTFFGQTYDFPDARNKVWQVYVGLKFF